MSNEKMPSPSAQATARGGKAPLEFWFDFSSPYGYLASTQIDEIAADYGRSVVWRPFLLWAVFKVVGTRPLTEIPLKSDYSRMDFDRYARLLGVPFHMPSAFPFSSLYAARAFYWLSTHHPKKAILFAERVFEAVFVESQDVSTAQSIIDLVASLDITQSEIEAGIGESAVKNKLKEVNEEAIQRGVFGSPFVIVDGQSFWGTDRLWMVEEWLETGGW